MPRGFVALDAVLFYVFFEVTLVGMYFVIAGWGYEGRQRAALTFFLYTLLGSLAATARDPGPLPFQRAEHLRHAGVHRLAAARGDRGDTRPVAMLVTFFVKTPVFPVHTWLPAAHVEAPTPGSVILAGVHAEARHLRPGALRPADDA